MNWNAPLAFVGSGKIEIHRSGLPFRSDGAPLAEVAAEVVHPTEGGIRSREGGRMGRQRYRGQEYKRVQNDNHIRPLV